MSSLPVRSFIVALGVALILGCAKTEKPGQTSPAFQASWKKSFNGIEEVIDVKVSGDQFVIAQTRGLIRTTEIFSQGKLVRIHKIEGGERTVSNDDPPDAAQYKRFWLKNNRSTLAKDQSNPPQGRQATRYELEVGGSIVGHEWVDDRTGLLVARESKFPQGTETLELLRLEEVTSEAATFDPASY
jgi:hypothetical protein